MLNPFFGPNPKGWDGKVGRDLNETAKQTISKDIFPKDPIISEFQASECPEAQILTKFGGTEPFNPQEPAGRCCTCSSQHYAWFWQNDIFIFLHLLQKISQPTPQAGLTQAELGG